MTTIKQDLDFFVVHNGGQLKTQEVWQFKFKDIFGENCSYEDVVRYLKDTETEFYETKDGVKFYTKHPFETDIIYLSKYEV